jgi:maleate cis-trans isomerase
MLMDYYFGKKVLRQEANHFFIHCTDFPAIEILHHFAQETGKPSISRITTSLWVILKK